MVGSTGDTGDAANARLNNPTHLLYKKSLLFIADTSNSKIRVVNLGSGVINTIVGTSIAEFNADGQLGTQTSLNRPFGLCLDTNGNIVIADTLNYRIRVFYFATHTVKTVAGTGSCCYGGDGGLATSATISLPYGVAVDSSNNIYLSDMGNNRIRKVLATTSIISTVAGTGFGGLGKDGIPATSTFLNSPSGIFINNANNLLYFADTNNHRIRMINLVSGLITTVAGSSCCYGGDGSSATSARLNFPKEIAFDSSGNLYITDKRSNRIRFVTAVDGVITTIAGTGMKGYVSNNLPGLSEPFNTPQGIAVDASGNIYIADSGNSVIRGLIGKH